MAAKHGYDLNDPVAHGDFIERVKSSIQKSQQSKTAVFGKRTESLFAYVVGALGKVRLLKQEDAGDVYIDGEEVLAPDYRLTMSDGTQFFVEVKNCHIKNFKKRFVVNKRYLEKLKGYSDINGLDLKFAVYFSSVNYWTLLSINSFQENESGYSIDFGTAKAKSEMLKLGDCMIGTAPNLELHLLANSEEAKEIDAEGNALFVTREVKIFCANQEVTDELEKNIAFYLMRFGTWRESETEPLIHKGKLLGVRFVFSPEEQEEPNFALIGCLSTMVSNGFSELTVKDGVVVALNLGINPDVFKALIPADYKGINLPLWIFHVQSNPDFKGVEGGSEN